MEPWPGRTPPSPLMNPGPRAIVSILSHQEISLRLAPLPIRCLVAVTEASSQTG
jgi:hypothetical protein